MMNNRTIILSGCLMPFIIFAGNKKKQETPKPNILWLTFEDTSPQFIGCYGDPYAKTPVIDALAANGVRFTSAFSTGTVSSPSRFCLITGCRTTTMGTGHHRSNYNIPDFVHGFPEFLRDAGYYTSNNVKTDYNFGQAKAITKASWNECSEQASWKKRTPGQPFFAVFNSVHSHQSRTMTNPWEDYQARVLNQLNNDRITPVDARFEMPTFYLNSPEMRKNMSRVYNSISLTDQEFGEILKQLEQDGLRDSTIIFCFSDHGEGIPRGKGSSLGLGYRVPFIIWIPEMYKHLSPWGSGVITDRLVSFEDFGATVLSLAGVKIPSYIEGKAFMGSQSSVEKKYVFGGCDAVDGNTELSRSVTDGRYIYTRVFTAFQPFVRWMSYYDHGDIQKQMRKDFASGLLNDVQSEIMQSRTTEYLYDLKNDKWETTNLALSPYHQKELKVFRNQLRNYLIKSKDAHFIPQYTLNNNKEKQIPFYLRQNTQIYPVKEVINAAMLCGTGELAIPLQLKLLKNENYLVTFWAAMGLFTQRNKVKSCLKELKVILPSLNYPLSKLFISGAILNIEENAIAREIIEEGILSPDIHIAIQALQILLEMDIERARTFVPVVQQSEEKFKNTGGRGYVNSMTLVVRLRLENKDFIFTEFW